jgi:hypothetical protein
MGHPPQGWAARLVRQTQKNIARDYQVAKYYAWNSKNWWVNGRWKASNGGWPVLKTRWRFGIRRSVSGKIKDDNSKTQVQITEPGAPGFKRQRVEVKLF